MDVLKIKFQASSSNVLTTTEYEVGPSLKEKYAGEKGALICYIDMKIKDVEMFFVQDSFKIEYARYLQFKPNTPETNHTSIKSGREGSFPTVGHIVMIHQLLCYFKSNFVNLSYGNEFDFGKR